MAEEKKICAKFKGWWKSLDKARVLIGVFVVLIAGLISASIILYMCYFCGGISSDHKRWSEFGDYIAGIAGMLNVIAVVVLNVLVRRIDNKRTKQANMLHAEELVVDKLQVQIEVYHSLYTAFEKNKSRKVAKETFEFLQPLMTYLYYLKSINFLPKSTKQRITDIHRSLFGTSDLLYAYAEKIDQDTEENQQIVKVLKTYRELYRMLIELEVLMTGDIAGENMAGENSNYQEEHPDRA